MSTTDDTSAARRGSGSNDLLGQASEAVPLVERLREMSRRGHWPLLGDEAADEIERLRTNARELDRLMLVIESAVRHSDPKNHGAVMALILANRDAVSGIEA